MRAAALLLTAALTTALAIGSVAAPRLTGVVHAAETKPAERLHEAAVAAHRAGRLRQAIELWRDALKLDANWKYAYNLANTLYESGEGMDAWTTLNRAELLQTPEKYAGLVAELRSKVRALLFKDHALLVLQVVPADARVTRDGVPLAAPYEVWVTTTESTIEAAAEGFVSRTAKVSHPLGGRREVPLVLAAKPTAEAPLTGMLFIEGGPTGARVSDHGVDLGVLPLAMHMVVGMHTLVVSHPGHVATTREVVVSAGAESRVQITLVKEAPPFSPNGLATPGWVTLVSGLAVAGIGTGFYFWAASTSDDIDALATSKNNFEIPFREYARSYDSLHSALDDRLLASQILLAVGGAAVVAGITMILLDDAPGEGDLRVVPIAGGGMVLGGASF